MEIKQVIRDSIDSEFFKKTAQLNNSFKNMDLSKIYPLEYSGKKFIFENCLFLKVDFSGINIKGLHAKNCDFLMCDFDEANMVGVVLENCKFYDRESMKGCYFRSTDLRRAIFKNCDISNGNFQRAIMFQSEFYDCKAQGVNLKFADFTHVISRTQIMAQAVLKNCNFKYASFEGVYLKGCDLSESIFINTDFTNSVLDECDFINAVLCSPILFQATIEKADLRNADISGIDLKKFAFSGIKICEWQQTNLLEEYGIIVFPDSK
jgi:fluoroquinolone resistance protein